MHDAGRRANNFDIVRLLAALSVVFSHAYLIAEGSEAHEPFVWLTGGQCVLGLVGVFVFFTISGYLVTESYVRRPVPIAFGLRRLLRIYPGLIVNLLICGLALGALVTTLPAADYVSGAGLRHYLIASLGLPVTGPPLPGVLFVDNPVGTIVNGSLWTLRYELMMYLMVVVLGVLRLLRLATCLLLVGIGILSIYFEQALTPWGDLGEWAWLVGFYAAGMALYFLRDRISFEGRYALLAVACLAGFIAIDRLIMLFPLAGAYLVIWFARRYDRRLDYARYVGDLSYGVYIYGWPAEEFVAYMAGGQAAWWQVLIGGLAIAVPLAYLSWHVVEKPCLSLARRLSPRSPSADDGRVAASPV